MIDPSPANHWQSLDVDIRRKGRIEDHQMIGLHQKLPERVK